MLTATLWFAMAAGGIAGGDGVVAGGKGHLMVLIGEVGAAGQVKLFGAEAANIRIIFRRGAGDTGSIVPCNAVSVVDDAAEHQNNQSKGCDDHDNGGSQAELFRAGHGWLPNFGNVTVYNIQLFLQATVSEHTVLLIEL